MACVEKPIIPSNAEIESLYSSKKASFEKLKDQIQIDLGKGSIVQIGSKTKAKGGFSESELASYIIELEKISVQKLTAYNEPGTGIQTIFQLASSGFAFGGCISEVMHYEKGQPFIRDWADPYKLLELKEGWYAHTLCN